MPFPEVERVIFHKNPLRQVICQVRFTPILKIDSDILTLGQFQESIRREFPNYEENTEIGVEIPQGAQLSVPPEIIKQAMQLSGAKNYEFSSEDRIWKINLTRTFLALSTVRYHRWEEFRERLSKPLDSLLNIYSPTYFTRIGLRYVNVIKRSKLGLEDVEWKDLLQTNVLGTLGSPDVSNNVRQFESRYDIGLSDDRSGVIMVTRFAEDDDSEKCYMIDSDFFNADRLEIDQILPTLNYLNSRSSRLIQWSITKRLYEAMEPEVV